MVAENVDEPSRAKVLVRVTLGEIALAAIMPAAVRDAVILNPAGREPVDPGMGSVSIFKIDIFDFSHIPTL